MRAGLAWEEDELDVLVAAYFSNRFSAGDDSRPECARLARAFGRSPAAVDRQWRNANDVCSEGNTLNVGRRVRDAVHDYQADPNRARTYAREVCRRRSWDLLDLLEVDYS